MSGDIISKGFMDKMKEFEINSIDQLLLYLPTKYLDFRKPASNIMSCLDKNERSYLKLKLVSNPEINELTSPAQIKLRFTDGITVANAIVFGGAYIWKEYKEGSYLHITCKVELYNGRPQIKSPEIVSIREQNRIVPVYKGKEKTLSSQKISENIAVALREFSDASAKYISDSLGVSESKIVSNAARGFTCLSDVFKSIHRPRNMDDINQATKAVRQINAYQALLLTLNAQKKAPNLDSCISYDVDMIKRMLKNLPFGLTRDQKRAVWDITKDLNSEIPMDRLLSGDVGCGKTMSYAIPAACAHLSGKNVVIMMPNLLLASQVAKEIKESFPDVAVELIIGGGKRKSEPVIGNPIIVGTSAILWWMKDINYTHSVDLLIIDEQQKLGSDQKKEIVRPHTNILEATATAIPRTSALVKYGTKTVSYIEECPVKKTIVTKITGSDEKPDVYQDLINIVKKGYQIAVLYPIRKKEFSHYKIAFSPSHNKSSEINDFLLEKGATNIICSNKDTEENELESKETSVVPFDLFAPETSVLQFKANGPSIKRIKELFSDKTYNNIEIIEIPDPEEEEVCKRNVENAAKHWEKIYPGRVVMIHGGLSTKEKLLAIEKAKTKDCSVIITSSVIEIGLTMPDLRGLLVVDADKYGASTLHQFRGRLARKGGEGVFYMGVNCKTLDLNEKSLNRLNLLVKYSKGFQIAEDDMRQRGFGDLSVNGVKQAGFVNGIFPGLKMTPQDIEMLLSSNDYAESKQEAQKQI